MTFPAIPTPDGLCHSFLALAPVVPPPLRWEAQVADVQTFDPEKMEAERKANPTLYPCEITLGNPQIELFLFIPKGY